MPRLGLGSWPAQDLWSGVCSGGDPLPDRVRYRETGCAIAKL
jgi:hypothetical protein